jgi:hypothetical protein
VCSGASYSAAGDYAFYKNGVPDGTGNSNKTTSQIGYVGAFAPGYNAAFGTISYVLLYNRVLTPSEIQHNYTVLKRNAALRGISLP